VLRWLRKATRRLSGACRGVCGCEENGVWWYPEVRVAGGAMTLGRCLHKLIGVRY
jgi:hypothetical protein